MFNWFFKARDGTTENMVEFLTIDVKKLSISKLAVEKAVGMIAKAVAKSEFIVQRKDGKRQRIILPQKEENELIG